MELRPYQLEAIEGLRNSIRKGKKSPLLLAATGSGKCLAKGTLVKLHSGKNIPVEELKVGDLIMGADSTPRKIKSLASGYETMYKIIPVKGDLYIVNESHILSLKVVGKTANCHTKEKLQIRFNHKYFCS